jgi:hypothetical protein
MLTKFQLNRNSRDMIFFYFRIRLGAKEENIVVVFVVFQI